MSLFGSTPNNFLKPKSVKGLRYLSLTRIPGSDLLKYRQKIIPICQGVDGGIGIGDRRHGAQAQHLDEDRIVAPEALDEFLVGVGLYLRPGSGMDHIAQFSAAREGVLAFHKLRWPR